MNITKAINFNRKPRALDPKYVQQRLHTIPIQIKKIYTDVDGAVIAKAAAPAILQTRFPVFLLGEFDRQAGYLTGRKICAPDNGTYFLTCFVNGSGGNSADVVGFSGLNTVQNQMQFGDVVLVYTDSLNNPSAFVWFVIKNTSGSMGSILANSATTQNDKRLGRLNVYEVNLNPDTDTQNTEDLHITRYDNITNFDDNTVQPLGIYRSIMDKQRTLITLKLQFEIDQYLGINFYMLYACDVIQFDLKIIKL